MAYGFGTTVNPQLGAVDYSNYLRGALSGAQMQAEGGAAIGKGIQGALGSIGEGIKKYQDNKIISSKLSADNERKLTELLNIDRTALDKADKKTQNVFDKMQKGGGVSIEELTRVNAWLGDAVLKGREAMELNAVNEAFSLTDATPNEIVKTYLRSGGKSFDVINAVYSGAMTSAKIGEINTGITQAETENRFFNDVGSILGQGTGAGDGLTPVSGTTPAPSAVSNFVSPNPEGEGTTTGPVDFTMPASFARIAQQSDQNRYQKRTTPNFVSTPLPAPVGTPPLAPVGTPPPAPVGTTGVTEGNLILPDIDAMAVKARGLARNSKQLKDVEEQIDAKYDEYVPRAQTLMIDAINRGQGIDGLKNQISPGLFARAYASPAVQQVLSNSKNLKANQLTFKQAELNKDYPSSQWDYDIVFRSGDTVTIKGLSPRAEPPDITGQEVAKSAVKYFETTYEGASKARRDINKALRTKALIESSDVNTGVFARAKQGLDRFIGEIKSKSPASRRAAATELLESELGSSVFELLVPLGIGARGLDTPEEREFLIKVLTGSIEMTKEALLGLVKNRYDLSVGAIESHNDRFENNPNYVNFLGQVVGTSKSKFKYPSWDSKPEDRTSTGPSGGGPAVLSVEPLNQP